jgi:hypothetical protein
MVDLEKPKLARDVLGDVLTAHMPRKWRIIRSQTSLDTIGETVVMLKLSRITKNPAAPLSDHIAEFVVTIVTAIEDPAAAEDDLDDSLITLLHALDGYDNLDWTGADKVSFSGHFAYDVTVQLTTRKVD